LRPAAVAFGGLNTTGRYGWLGPPSVRKGVWEPRETVRTSNNPGEGVDKGVTEYVGTLSEEHKMLVALKTQLYGGSWEPMLDDLRNRLAGKPYIFKLVHRIQDDIERIEQMQKFEAEHKVDLADYVDLS
jgi:hypothetical protein